MAEAVLFNIAQQLLNNMSSAAIEEVASAWGYKTQLVKLKNTINTIRDVLLDAEQKQPNSHAIRGWLQRLRVAVYDADDLFDEITSLTTQKDVCLFFSKINQLHFGSTIARKIKHIRENLDDIAKDGMTFGFRLRVDEEGAMGRKKREQSYSYVREEDIVGRDSDKVAILGMLLSCNVEEVVSVIPVVGIGGLGKTTLAQLVYNYEKVEDHFELRLWVCVSDVFDIKVIVEKILASTTYVKPGDLDMEQLQRQLRNCIGGKRYFLVLDDVWNEDREEWLKLRALLFCGGPGSKILVTTRSRQVASIMATGSCYDLRHLSEAESWFLFGKMAFEPGQESKDPKLVEVGKQIVRKCANVPLAIRTVGGLLYARDQKRWLAFKDNELAKITETENSIMPILKLSYDHLQSSLKHCFAYCALFPKDYELQKERLISLWIAGGFVVPSCERQSLEDAGEECFMDLIQRCFFQDLTKDTLGNIKSCRIHDLMHDLALLEAGRESIIFTSDTSNLNQNTHHLSSGFNLTSSWEIPSCLLELNRLRTFLLPEQAKFGTRIRKSVSDQLVSNFRRLRVLDLHGLGIENLSNSIGGLIHLRLSKCYRLRKLPTDIKRLINLRCLEVDDCDALAHMPTGMGRLTALRKLNQFVVGSPTAAFHLERCAQLRDLSSLNNISGDLQILLQGKWKAALSEAKDAKLYKKLHITKLVLDFFEANRIYHEPLLEGLQPSPNVKILAITYYAGQSFPSWARLDKLNSFLPSLVEINISNCNRSQCLPFFSQLLCLKRLHITYAHSVEYMENTGLSLSASPVLFFPSLEELTLDRMGNLRGWWKQAEGIHDYVDVTAASYNHQDNQVLPCFPRLCKLHLQNCAKLREMPLFPHVEELKLVNVDENLSLRKAVETFTTVPLSLLSSRLKTLEIDNVDHFISLPKEHLQNLSCLGLWQCSKLVDLSGLGEGLRNLPSLRILTFFHCDQLTSLCGGLQHLTSLQELLIRKCKELNMLDEEEKDGMPWKALKALRCLRLRYIPKMVSLPFGLQHVTSLRFLEIVGCDGLTTLPGWISSFSLLQWLSIRECSKLMELPEGFIHLSKLKELEITACPRLTRRCRRPRGEDWLKIQHIPSIIVRESHWDNA
ncbi:putative disease resistance protein RGA3 isoform X2 [Spinacia oleracea]|uniref:Disease resistance protein RGA3 isoform X2 n=1 Tax=Spinacia oleracea TaxID=3562 RepID=A0ABM3R931_SPIOL|nr:putative disease resistance protein RGA3 isoform X2 [Spinacia oleracea]